MTADRITTLAQTSPLPNLTQQLGQEIDQAHQHVARLTATLTRLDQLRDTLKEHGLPTIDIDLGPIGNSAASARRAEAAGRPAFVAPIHRTNAA